MSFSGLVLACGALLAAAGVVVHLNAMTWWGARIDGDWVWAPSYIGMFSFADESGEFPDEFSPAESRRTVRYVETEDGPALEDNYQTLDIRTKEVVWSLLQSTPIDPVTGEGAPLDGSPTHVLFPRFSEKKSYVMGLGYFTGLRMDFVREETVEGLNAFLYSYVGRFDNTVGYTGDGVDAIGIGAGERVLCIDDQYSYKTWVEPVTGEILKYEESCYSGDAVFDIATKEKLRNLSRWGGETLTGSVKTIAAWVSEERARLLFLLRDLGNGLIAVGVMLFLLGLFATRGRQKAG